MSRPAVEVRDLVLRFGNLAALDGIGFDVAAGELFAVIGPNGAGKSCLLNVLSRVYAPTSGTVRIEGTDILRAPASRLAQAGVARSFQNVGLFSELSVLDNVLIGRHHLMRAQALRCGLGLARREDRRHRQAAVDALRFVGAEAYVDTPVRLLSYGRQKQVELARCIAMEPRVMLLDEPVAGMSPSERVEVTALVQRLHRERETTIVLVEHDMGMVMRVAERVLVLDFGRPIALGPPAQVQADDQVIRAYLGEPVEAIA